jgi:hypothetical protein
VPPANPWISLERHERRFAARAARTEAHFGRAGYPSRPATTRRVGEEPSVGVARRAGASRGAPGAPDMLGAMAYDVRLADRVRKHLEGRADVVEKKMFGGLAFMVAGQMACGVVKDELMVRVGEAGYAGAMARPHTRPMDFTGRPSKGAVFVCPPGCRTLAAVGAWVDRAVAVAEAKPRKKRSR